MGGGGLSTGDSPPWRVSSCSQGMHAGCARTGKEGEQRPQQRPDTHIKPTAIKDVDVIKKAQASTRGPSSTELSQALLDWQSSAMGSTPIGNMKHPASDTHTGAHTERQLE